jgi:hypothetical protein
VPIKTAGGAISIEPCARISLPSVSGKTGGSFACADFESQHQRSLTLSNRKRRENDHLDLAVTSTLCSATFSGCRSPVKKTKWLSVSRRRFAATYISSEI